MYNMMSRDDSNRVGDACIVCELEIQQLIREITMELNLKDKLASIDIGNVQ